MLRKDKEGNPFPGKLENADDVQGNMVIMTNEAELSGVTMARIAKESGAVALLVVNTDEYYLEDIYPLVPMSEAEYQYARDHIDIPVCMTSITSANILTNVNNENGNIGMPDMIRLYNAEERPFFEEITRQDPTLYLIHQLLTENECDFIIQNVEKKLTPLDDTKSNYLEHIIPAHDGNKRAVNVETAWIWRGFFNSHHGSQIDLKLEQITGYPRSQFSDWQIFKFSNRSYYDIRYDTHPLHEPAVTISVFLVNLPEGVGGEQIYPYVRNGNPVKIIPHKGMAVVHHNIVIDEDNGNSSHDKFALYGDSVLNSVENDASVKYIARRYIYQSSLPLSSRKLVLPFISLLNGGVLPQWVVIIYETFLKKFGFSNGEEYFEKLCILSPFLFFCFIAIFIRIILFRNRQNSFLRNKPLSNV